VTTFSTPSRARFRRTRRPAPAGSEQGRGSPERGKRGRAGVPAVSGIGETGVLAAGGRQPGPLPQARLAHRRGPLPRRHAPSVVPRLQEQPGCPPAPGILSPRKLPVKGAPTGASLRFAPGRPLTASFPGKDRRLSGRTGECRDSLERQDHAPGAGHAWATAPRVP